WQMETRARTCHSERTEESASIVVLSPQKQIHRFARDDIVRGFSAACWLSTHNFDGRPSFQQMLGVGSAAALETFVTTNQIPRSARNDSLKAFTGHQAGGRRVAQFNRLHRAYLRSTRTNY